MDDSFNPTIQSRGNRQFGIGSDGDFKRHDRR
jgi:hypothetical protein